MGAWMGDTPRTPTSKLVTASGVTRRSPPAAGSTQLMLWWPKLPALCKSTLGSKKKTHKTLTYWCPSVPKPLPAPRVPLSSAPAFPASCRMTLPGLLPSPDPTVMGVGNVTACPSAQRGPRLGVSAPEMLFVGLTGKMKWFSGGVG